MFHTLQVIFPLILLAFSPILLQANFELPLNKEIIVPMESINGLVVFEAEINGRVGKFVLDSGADAILLDQKENSKSNQEVQHFQSLNSEFSTQRIEIQSFDLGGIKHNDLEAYTTDLSALESYIGNDLAGLVGFSFFVPNTLTINFEKEIITISNGPLEKIANSLNVLDFEMIDNIPVAQVKLGDKKFLFALDSGASTHVIDQKLSKRRVLNFKASDERVDLITASGKMTEITKVSCNQMMVGEYLSNAPSFLVQNFDSINENLSTQISGILSLNKLCSSIVMIQSLNNQIYFN